MLLMSLEERKSKTGSDYVVLTLTDGEQVITANMWNRTASSYLAVHSVFDVSLEARSYNEGCVFNVLKCDMTQENPDQYIPHAPLPAEKMYAEIYAYAEKLGIYGSVTTSILTEYKDSLLLWTAAKKIHHNIRGGLLFHIYRMLKTSCYIAGCYQTLDKNLLCAGTILHDIGKLKELQCDELGATEYTVDGNLFGHLFQGAEIIAEHAKKVGLPEEESRLLKHMIVAHHGKQEYGAIRTPAIPEASVLYHIDNMDAEVYQYEEIRKNMEPRTMSDFIFGLNTRVYNF